jgi:hypothetical protein
VRFLASAIYSRAVLLGMQNRGIRLADIARITGMPLISLRLVLKQKARFSSAHLSAIERITDVPPSEFALMACENPDLPFANVMRSLAAVRSPSRRSGRLLRHA